MDLREFKMKLLDTGLFKKKSGREYITQTCPFCGDNKGHMYVLIDLNSDTPVLYHCFKCPARGIMNKKFLELLGVEDLVVPRSKSRRRVYGNDDDSSIKVKLNNEELFEYKDEDAEYIQMCKEYIKYRVGVVPTDEELKMFGIIGKPYYYYKTYLNGTKGLDRNRMWCMCSNGMIAGRRMDNGKERLWVKESGSIEFNNRALYIMRKQFDMSETINVCIAEGILDVIGLYYHYPLENATYIACLGRDYASGIKHILNKGIYGDSVNIKIFLDKDVVGKIKLDDIMCDMFHSVTMYQNSIDKDYGLHEDRIIIEKCL